MPRKQERCQHATFGEGAKGHLADKMGLRVLAKGRLVGKIGNREGMNF